MATTIDSIFNKTLFQRLLNSRKSNTEVIYFDKTTKENGESNSKVFDIDATIFYKPFEIEINYDITNQTQAKNTIAFFCCRKNQNNNNPSVHIFAINKILNIDMSNIGSSNRITTNVRINDKGKINIKYNEGIIKLYFDDVINNAYDLSTHKLTSNLSNKCSVGQSYSTVTGNLANGINGTVNVIIKELKE